MSSAGKWREEQVLIICPGSQTTLAQMGCSELTPPAHRFPTRMFRDGDAWRPYRTYMRKKTVAGVETEEWVEDVDSDEGATYPLQAGRIVNMEAFLAFLDHVHSMLTTTYHNTPIMLMASPQWTRPDCEAIAQYIFEKTRTPALCLIHSAVATQYGLKFPTMTVVDIGYEKVDVSAIYEGRVVHHVDIGSGLSGQRAISGGEVFTRRLEALLKGQGFNKDMAEQLKRSVICEVLPYASGEDALAELPTEDTRGVGAAGDVPVEELALPPKPAENGEDGAEGEKEADDDGVLDVASIVTSGQTKEFLAKKEKEKGKPGRKPKEVETTAQKAARLSNKEKTHNTFVFEEVVQEEVKPQPKVAADAAAPAPAALATADTTASGEKPAESANADGAEPKPESQADVSGEASDDKPAAAQPEAEPSSQPPAEPKVEELSSEPELRVKRVKRDIEVGLERFTFASREEIDRIVQTIYRAIQGIEDQYMRPACWENLVFVGNGARLRGLRDNILQTLNARHLVSPSTATMFTSELPSNVATPTGTGAQTPTGSFTGAPHQLGPNGVSSSSGVNPLLQAATTANTLGVAGGASAPTTVATPQGPGSEAGGATHVVSQHFHSQTPTAIKTVSLPTYLQEWTRNGFEESMFLGAQVAARIVFCVHSNMDAQSIEAQRMASLSRVDYK
ncbi:uncharacterized protein J7T54_006746 [Emericellopsis cladophorae]|uniref:Actin-like protein n=1 Tax=Emericellopsis cladophorae TaxID=2686198 RepID=A0A9Q0BI28_9HYPO|nr:uncharacterized protein J7T54_006746 [Emericellopsis cladophorae]KAI6785104.1 hypothetical protein J7T54_006746 [Emericellopsis cladophorae]